MKETYFVGHDPELKMWDAQLLTPDFHESCWVFKVTARTNHDALVAGLAQYRQLAQKPTAEELALMSHLSKEVGRRPRKPEDTLMVDVPSRYLQSAQSLSERGFFTLAHREEALLILRSAGWKAIEKHVADNISQDREMDSLMLA